jgi:hypothetical protein
VSEKAAYALGWYEDAEGRLWRWHDLLGGPAAWYPATLAGLPQRVPPPTMPVRQVYDDLGLSVSRPEAGEPRG